MRRLLIPFLAFSVSGCATLFGDKDRVVRVDSTPQGAKVLLNGMPYGKTPTTVQINNMLSSNIITVKKDGYEEATRPVDTSIQGIAFLNLLNIVCWGIDFATGNVYKIDNKSISFDLDKKKESTNNNSPFLVPLNPTTSLKPQVELMCRNT